MTSVKRALFSALLATCLSGASLFADTASAARYDTSIQTAVTQKLAAKSRFQDVKASTEDGIVTLPIATAFRSRRAA